MIRIILSLAFMAMMPLLGSAQAAAETSVPSVSPLFSVKTAMLLLFGWAAHWAFCIRKAKSTARAAKTQPPTWLSYWYADPESLLISVIGCAAGYFVIPYFGETYPDIARFIGSTAKDPMNPLAAFLGGYFMPSIADYAGKRIAALVGD